MNGQPYISPLADDWWQAIVSNSENPIRILIELIWTRLANQFSSYFPMDDTLRMERLAPCISARFGSRKQQVGWEYRIETLSPDELSRIEPTLWEPEVPDENELTVLWKLGLDGTLDVHDPVFLAYAAEAGFDPVQLIDRLVAKRILAWADDHTVRPIQAGPLITGFTADGKSFATTEVDLFGLWISNQIANKAPNKNKRLEKHKTHQKKSKRPSKRT